jgi:hypothetical protein
MIVVIRRMCVCAVIVALACGDSGEPTTTSESAGEASTGTTTTTTTTTSSTTGTTAEPTTGSTGDDPGTTMMPPACETDAASCGVSVSEQSSECPMPPPDGSGLTLEALGPGSIRITEHGYDSNCGLTISPVVKLFAGNNMSVSYEVGGQPMDGCICKYTISLVVSNLPSGTWTVSVLPHQEKIDVP